MINTVLITAATAREMECMDKVITDRFEHRAATLISGIGPVSTVYAVMNYLASSGKPDLIINIGIAGSYRGDFPVGTVVVPLSDRFADLGVCEGDKVIPISRADIKDVDDNYTPSGIFNADKGIVRKLAPFLSPVKAVTVSTATGSIETREKIREEYNPDIESMEGAAVYYICNKQDIPCIAIRSISNMVGPRNKSLWDIDLALEQLKMALVNYLNDMVI